MKYYLSPLRKSFGLFTYSEGANEGKRKAANKFSTKSARVYPTKFFLRGGIQRLCHCLVCMPIPAVVNHLHQFNMHECSMNNKIHDKHTRMIQKDIIQTKRGWLGSRMVSVLDSGTEGLGSNRSRAAIG